MQKRGKDGRFLKTHGMEGTKTYISWFSMIQRCLNKNNISYKSYGERNITVCPKWLKFKNFYRDMGKVPKNKSLDRIDNNGNYCKKNCKWSTKKEQQNNTRRSHFLTFNGKIQTMKQWSEELDINYNIIKYRVKNNFDIKDILKI